MASGGQRPVAQEFVLAVREHHRGSGSEEALQARLRLAEQYLEADLCVDAIEVLLGAVIDANRLYGPTDDRAITTRLLLGAAYEAADRPFDACGVYENLRVDVRAARSSDDPLWQKVMEISDVVYAGLEAAHGPFQ